MLRSITSTKYMSTLRLQSRNALNIIRRSESSSSSSGGGGLMSIPKEYPFLFQLAVATGKTSAADLVCQVSKTVQFTYKH